ncbi:MAG: FAD:protein FMN transferase [Terricaulis sp.]
MLLSSVADAPVRRAKPLLGTIVAIEARGHRAESAVQRAFAEIARIHALMSFHEDGSDINRINRSEIDQWVRVDPATLSVLIAAQNFAELSNGAFDVTIGGALVAAGLLPSPERTHPSPHANWTCLELDPQQQRVRRRARAWIDLGGIAKGFAVDHALAVLRDAGCEYAVVNAGGDVASFGRDQPTLLRPSIGDDQSPVITLRDGALAVSDASETPGAHAHKTGAMPLLKAACVLAPTCMEADAFTKIVLFNGDASAAALAALGSFALVRDDAGWRELGSAHA